MNSLTYAGIGSRETPSEVLDEMKTLGTCLGINGFTLRTGGAEGADIAFEKGCDICGSKKEIYTPWKNFSKYSKNEIVAPNLSNWKEALQIAEKFHPAWNRLSTGAQKLITRNTYQVLGLDLNSPVDLVVCWTKDGKASGGTGQAIRLAESYKIPVFNLKNENCLASLSEFIKSLQI